MSHWRRRHEDFPASVSENSKGRPLFALHAVEGWLQKHDRIAPDASAELELLKAVDLLVRAGSNPDHALRTVCALTSLSAFVREHGLKEPFTHDLQRALSAEQSNPILWGAFERMDTSPASSSLYSHFATLETRVLEEVFTAALDRGNWQHDQRTPTLVAATIARLVSQQENVGSIFDPAAGSCGLLTASSGALGHRVELSAQDINAEDRALGRQRLAFANEPCDYRPGDSLSSDAFPRTKFDAVVSEPPFGLRIREPLPMDTRWLPAAPPQRSADSAWLQHCLSHLSSHGSAYLVQSRGLLNRGSRNELALRRELVRRGLIEAIIGLPGGIRRNTSIPTVLWVLRSPEAAQEGSPILMAEVEAKPANDAEAEATADSIAQVVKAWRQTQTVEPAPGVDAAAVSALDLLDEEINLLPVRWLRKEASTSDLESWSKEVEGVLGALKAISGDAIMDTNSEFPTPMPLTSPVRGWVSVGDLIKQKQLSLISATPRRADQTQFQSDAVELVRVKDLSSSSEVEKAFVASSSEIKTAQLTAEGDVLFAASHGTVRAWVEDRGNRVPSAPLRGLRIHGDWISPRVLRFALESERNQALAAGTTVMSVKPKQLELPLLSPEEDQELDRWLAALEQAEERATAIQETVSSAKLSLSRLMSADPRN